MKISVFEWMEDFDNAELDPIERQEQLEYSVKCYNEKFGTKHDPNAMFMQYEIKRNLQDH